MSDPRVSAQPAYDATEVGVQVGPFPVAAYDIVRTHRSGFKDLEQVFANLREEGDDPFPFAFVMLGFWASHCEPVVLPIHIRPAQGKGFAGNAEAAETGQGDQKTPLCIGGRVDDFGDRLSRHEDRAGVIDLRA